MNGLFMLWHCLWGLPQTLLGGLLFLINCRRPHGRYRGAWTIFWKHTGCFCAGPFLFLEKDCPTPLLVHEYGHCLQSALLGVLYIPAVLIPSVLWFHLPVCRRLRRRGISYYRFYPELWASRWGQKVTGEKSLF